MRTRTPRGHWVLFLLSGLVLAAALLLNGFAHGAMGEGHGSHSKAAGLPPEEATRAGPVLRPGPGPVRSARPASGTIALTFDDGPDPTWTPRLLDVLRRHHAQATFFTVGARVAEHPELARRMVREGHEIGSHTYTHADMGAVPGWRLRLELDLTQRALAGATGRTTNLVRQPFSATPASLTGAQWAAAEAAARHGYVTVLADRDTGDWRRPGVERIVERAIGPAPGKGASPGGRARPGAIVMLHDSGGDRAQTVAAVDRLLTRLSARGYRFTTVSRAVGLPPGDVPASATDRAVGGALIMSQRLAGWLVGAMTVLFGVVTALTLLRLALMVLAARVHVRRTRRGRRGRGRPPTRRTPFTPPVSIVVPAYNEEAGLAATVRSLLDTDYPAPVEVIVVDDGSTDGTPRIARELARHPAVRVVHQVNGGKPSALNTGLSHARAEIVVLVDGDTVFQRDTLRRLVAPLADPRVGAVSGNTKVANRGGVLGRWQHLEYVIGFNLDRRLFDVLQCMPTIPGAIGAFRRQVLASVGGVPADTLAEDTDLTMAIGRAGWRVVYEERALAWTEAPSSLRQLWRQRYRWCYGTLQAMWKHRRAPAQRGPSGRYGRRCLPYLTVFQVVLPLFAPAVDVFTLYGLVFLNPLKYVVVWALFSGVAALVAAYALRLDGESLGPLWTLPLQQVVYRQLMYLVVFQSVVTALLGARLRWHTIRRTGTFGTPRVDSLRT
ncbi:bifunctional polysaccharide deacetylase/glycosyltransferase family 2 protein [Actinomadura miaoliensis]|uniref:bifunctional polysaccharide deacetylase/glycosyltransferase family 2 protein n=1 Tax=Actinomadura miaoliensis TaxID=430685 RepID=UPI0031E5A164